MNRTASTGPGGSRSEEPRVVIVGGGFGGLTAARALERTPVHVTLIDRCNYHLFQPLLYQVAMAGLSPAEIAVPIRSVLKGNRRAQVLLGELTRVDLPARQVHLDRGGCLPYDYLILAYGAKTNFFGHEDWGRHALGLKTIEDGLEIRRRVLLAFEAAERESDPEARRRLLTFVVIGGGPTGVEVAGALVELGRFVLADDFRKIRHEQPRVILVEANDRLLPGFDQRLADSARRQLEEIGAEVRLACKVVGIQAHGVALENEFIESTTVLWTAGVRAKRLSASLGVELDRTGRVPVRLDCSIPGYPEAFVIGDAASFIPPGAERPLPGVSPVAMQQARFVAELIEDRVRGRKTQDTFEYFDKGMMATIGRSRAVAQSGRLRMSGFVAWLAWLLVHIWYLIGFRNRFVVMFTWAWSYFTYKRGARLITGDRPWEQMLKLADLAEHPEAAQSPGRAAPSSEPAPSPPAHG